jgi:hypothetical protein
MSSATDYLESAILGLLFQNANIANLGDATGVRGSTAAGSVWVALYTATPGETGGGTETTYTNYARVSVARTSGAWTLSGTNPTQVANAAAVNFPQCGATGATITAFGVLDASTGGNLLGYGPLTYTAANGNTPSFAIGALTVTLA